SSVEAFQLRSIRVGLAGLAARPVGVLGASVSFELLVSTTSWGEVAPDSRLASASAVLFVVATARLRVWPELASGVTSTLVHVLVATGPDEPTLVASSAGAML